MPASRRDCVTSRRALVRATTPTPSARACSDRPAWVRDSASAANTAVGNDSEITVATTASAAAISAVDVRYSRVMPGGEGAMARDWGGLDASRG